MLRKQTLRARQKPIGELPIAGGCRVARCWAHSPKCARGEGHQVTAQEKCPQSHD
jgi:hypothetical protein